jgi:glycosyltransferase involved in cell wall biosynthesis
MKVLLVTNYFTDASRGGVEFHVQSLAEGLHKLGHSVTVLRTSELPTLFNVKDVISMAPFAVTEETRFSVSASKVAKVPGIRMMLNFLYRRKLGKTTVRWLKNNPDFLADFDLIHHHDFVTSSVISRHISRKHLTTPQYWTNHLGEFLLLNRVPVIGNKITRSMTSRYKFAFAPSTELSNQKGISCPVEMVPNGADHRVFHPLPAATREKLRLQLGWGAKELVVIVPRRWAPTKGVLFAAEALSTMPSGLELRCVFVGAHESDFEEYSRQINDCLRKTPIPVDIIGSVGQQEMANLLAASDLCLIPSLLEAVSLSALESLACGTPVLSTNVGGLPDVVVPNHTGWLIQPKRADMIAEQLLKILKMDRDTLRQMGQAGREMVIDSYSWESVSKRVAAQYEK